MQLTEIDHVGIAVSDLDAAIEWYSSAFAAEVVHREIVERDQVNEALIRIAESYVQLLSPTTEQSPMARFIAKRGEGIHHIAYRVQNCSVALDELRVAGVSLIDEVPRPGSRGTTVAFVKPHFGHLIELVEV